MATEQHSMSIWDVIRRHHQLHPEDSLRKIAHEIGVAPSTVHRVLWLSELGQLEPKPRGGQRARVDPMELYLIQLMAKHEVSAATRAQLFSIFNQLCLRYLERPTELKLDTFLYHLKKVHSYRSRKVPIVHPSKFSDEKYRFFDMYFLQMYLREMNRTLQTVMFLDEVCIASNSKYSWPSSHFLPNTQQPTISLQTLERPNSSLHEDRSASISATGGRRK
jgi:hypothetical protein